MKINRTKISLFVVSLLLVAFGQPAWNSIAGVLAAICGYALFWLLALDIPSWKQRFAVSTAWFTAVQLIQLSWFISHPYLYIYVVYLFFAVGIGCQFGVLSSFITKERLSKYSSLFALAGMWTLMEWLRLFFLAGFTWNPSGLALASTLYGLQTASLWGVYGMTFWVILTNLFVLRQMVQPSRYGFSLASLLIFLPYLFGGAHVLYHDSKKNLSEPSETKVLLVQTNFPAEEELAFKNQEDIIKYVEGEWSHILSLLNSHQDESYDLLVLPEAVVPYGTYYPIFNFENVKEIFQKQMGPHKLPKLFPHLAMNIKGKAHVNHAFWSQAIADIFQTPIVLGLQDSSDTENYLSAFIFYPNSTYIGRYDKRVLLPMAEYIPSTYCQKLAAKYGICGSFTCGETAKIFPINSAKIGLSICYEETFGNLMRENKELGAELLINITSDVWYPHSRLPQQHLEHSRLRTVEMGIPLARSCNTGVTCAIDSLGRTIKQLEDPSGEVENISSALSVNIPNYTYSTVYQKTGDYLIILISVFSLSFLFRKIK